MLICPKCGAQNPNGSPNCGRCGVRFVVPGAPVAPAYKPTSYANPPRQSNPSAAKGFAIASMVCGIVSFFLFGVVLGVLAIVFGCVAKNKGSRSPMATAGIVCGIVGLGIFILMMAIFGSAFAALGLAL